MANASFGTYGVNAGEGGYPSSDVIHGTASPWMMNSSDGMLAGNMSTNGSELPLPNYYSMPYRVAGCLFVSIIFIIGFVGNVMVVIVVSRTQSMHTPTNCYLVSLAIADILLLVSAPLPTIAEFFLIIDQSLLGGVGCAIMVFCQYLGVNVSSLSITAFTVERYIAICHPMRAQTMCTVRRAKRIIAALWVFGICYCVPWLALISTKTITYRDGTHIESCSFKLERSSYLTYYMADLVIFYIIPLLLTCVLYGLIGRILFTNTIPSTPGKASNGVHAGKKSSTSSSRVQVIKMLAVVVGMFATLWMPYRVYVVYNSFAKVRYQDLWFLLFCRIMVYMNSAINPILYNAMSVKFRRAFKRLLYCGDARRRDHMQLMLFNDVTAPATDMTSRNTRMMTSAGHRQSRAHHTRYLELCTSVYDCEQTTKLVTGPQHQPETSNGQSYLHPNMATTRPTVQD